MRPAQLNTSLIHYTEQELIIRSVAGDTAAYGELVRRHQRAVRHWLGKVTGDFSLADDLAQDTFLKAWDVLDTYLGKGEFRHWLLKIAWTTFLQAARKNRQLKKLVDAIEAETHEEPIQTSEQAAPEVDRLLAILTSEARACMLLSYSYGFSHQEVSDMLSLPLGTVKSVIRRSVLQIRQHFGIAV